jgi:hypothetical protein
VDVNQPALIDVPSDAEELDERYTTREFMRWICDRTYTAPNAWDIDLAACAASHWSERYYTLADDALVQPWFPAGIERAFLNSPWSDLYPWVKRVGEQMTRPGLLLAQVLPANRTEQPFWQQFIEPRRDRPRGGDGIWLRTFFAPGRTQYGSPANPEGRNKKNSPPFASVLLVWRT